VGIFDTYISIFDGIEWESKIYTGWWLEHVLFSVIYEMILPIDKLIFFKMVIAPPTRLLLAIINHIITIYEPLLTVY